MLGEAVVEPMDLATDNATTRADDEVDDDGVAEFRTKNDGSTTPRDVNRVDGSTTSSDEGGEKVSTTSSDEGEVDVSHASRSEDKVDISTTVHLVAMTASATTKDYDNDGYGRRRRRSR